MTGPRRTRRAQPGTGLLVVLLLLMLGLSGIMAYQATEAAQNEMRSTERALRGYAAFAAWEHARATLPRPPVAADRYGVGYVGTHECDGTDYAFFGWWARGNELYHHLLSCRSGRPDELASLTRADVGLAGCVWELGLVNFEREAWIRHGMRGGVPDVEGYLGARLEGWV